MAVVIPQNLNEIYRKLSGYKRNLVRFYPDRSGIINANDIDSIIMAVDDLRKNIEMIKVRIPVVLSPSIIQKIQTLTTFFIAGIVIMLLIVRFA